ncbi:MAG TPA: hypothetical protein VGF73_11845 [Chthoniobacterales bacterium]
MLQILGPQICPADTPSIVGKWEVKITFGSGEMRTISFDAQASGKGSFLSEGPKPNAVAPTEPKGLEWTQANDESIIVSGPVQFPLGNVGLERGTLVLKGKFGADGSLAGEAAFFPEGQDPKNSKAAPSKSGRFTAARLAD